MTREQLRAARAILGWSQDDLAALSGVSAPTIKRLEPGFGPVQTRDETLDKLWAAFASVGIVFHDEGGDGQLGVFYTPRAVLDAVMPAIKAPDDAAPVLDPACGTGGLISGSYPRTGKMRYVRGYGPGQSFAIPKERMDLIKSGESALRHFREFRGVSTQQIADALAQDSEGFNPYEDEHRLTELEVRAAEYIPLYGLPAAPKIARFLNVSPVEIYRHDKNLKPVLPPDELADAVKRLSAMQKLGKAIDIRDSLLKLRKRGPRKRAEI